MRPRLLVLCPDGPSPRPPFPVYKSGEAENDGASEPRELSRKADEPPEAPRVVCGPAVGSPKALRPFRQIGLSGAQEPAGRPEKSDRARRGRLPGVKVLFRDLRQASRQPWKTPNDVWKASSQTRQTVSRPRNGFATSREASKRPRKPSSRTREAVLRPPNSIFPWPTLPDRGLESGVAAVAKPQFLDR